MSRELARIRTDVPVTFDPDAVRYRGPSRERVLRAVLVARIPDAGHGVRADGGDRRRATTRSSRRLDDVRRAGGGAARRPAASASRRSPAKRRPCAPTSSAGRSRRRRDRRATSRWRTPDCATRRICRARDVFARLGPCWPIPSIAKIGHDLKFVDDRRRTRGRRARAAPTSTRWSRATWSTRRDRATRSTASRSSAPTYRAVTRRGRDRQGREGAGARRGARGVARRRSPASAPTCRCRSRPACRAISSRTGSTAVYRELEQPLIPVLADIERAGVQVDTRGARGARPQRCSASSTSSAGRSSGTPAASSTSTRRSSSPTCCSRS